MTEKEETIKKFVQGLTITQVNTLMFETALPRYGVMDRHNLQTYLIEHEKIADIAMEEMRERNA